jgi:ribosomal protein S18 acetylase RimI-like enzyme
MMVRPATEADLPRIAEILVETWRSTFRGKLSDAFLDGMSVEHQEARHRRRMGNPSSVYQVALLGGIVVGFASGGPDRTERDPCDAEVYALYVAEAHQGRGAGRALVDGLVSSLFGRGHQSLRVWVLRVNPAIAFYERLGGRQDRTDMIELGGEQVEQVSLVWRDLSAWA